MMVGLSPRLLTFAEFKEIDNKAVADGMWRHDRRIFLPGMGWYNNWYLERDLGGDFLSPHYYRSWAGKRPPIELVCPNGDIWCVDRRSSNGDGWVVTGEWPNITCSPSIVAGDYHGWLRDGVFTPDIDGKSYPIPNIGPDYGRR